MDRGNKNAGDVFHEKVLIASGFDKALGTDKICRSKT